MTIAVRTQVPALPWGTRVEGERVLKAVTLAGPCDLYRLCARLPDLTCDQVVHEVDLLTRQGHLLLTDGAALGSDFQPQGL